MVPFFGKSAYAGPSGPVIPLDVGRRFRCDAGRIFCFTVIVAHMVGDPTIADSNLDRLVHNTYRIEIKGESMGKKNKDAASNSTGGRS